MHNKRNVVVMFLLIMLSFAIITEVSAQSDAEIDGTGSNQSMISVDMPKHNSGERFNEHMQNHDDDFQSHNEQKSFNETPDIGDNKRNENLYEHDKDVRPDGNATGIAMFKGDMRPLDNFTGNMSAFDMIKPDLKFNQPKDLRDNKSVHVQNGELMDDVVSKLIGMNNISPNFKNNNNLPLKDKNKSAPQGPGDKNSSDMRNDGIKKDSKVLKKSNKNPKKSKANKKTSKKLKSNKKIKKTNKKSFKKSTKERVKL